jgi:hypothetical protein
MCGISVCASKDNHVFWSGLKLIDDSVNFFNGSLAGLWRNEVWYDSIAMLLKMNSSLLYFLDERVVHCEQKKVINQIIHRKIEYYKCKYILNKYMCTSNYLSFNKFGKIGTL